MLATLTTPTASLYDRLAAPFEETHTDVRGGVTLTYITGEQCISRLNDVLGVDGWSFEIKDQGINEAADECWAYGRLTLFFGERTIVKEQAGSQKVKRSRQSGQPLDIGFDLKGAATDALKKCATLVGVGLYLSHKEAKGTPRAPARPTNKTPASGAIPEQLARSDARRAYKIPEPVREDTGEIIPFDWHLDWPHSDLWDDPVFRQAVLLALLKGIEGVKTREDGITCRSAWNLIRMKYGSHDIELVEAEFTKARGRIA